MKMNLNISGWKIGPVSETVNYTIEIKVAVII